MNSMLQVLEQRLGRCTTPAAMQQLAAYIEALPHSQRRQAGACMAHTLLPQCADDLFWSLFGFLVPRDSRAWLGTFLRACEARHRQGAFSLQGEGACRVLDWMRVQGTPIDRKKLLECMVGLFADVPEELEHLLDALHMSDARQRLSCLLPHVGVGVYYLLFRAMRELEHDRELLARCCRYLMAKGDGLSFNMASVACAYFGLEEVRATFSLRLAPFQLGRMEGPYQHFKELLLSM